MMHIRSSLPANQKGGGPQNRDLCSRTCKRISLCRSADEVIVEDVPAAPHRDSHAVLVVLEFIVGHVGVKRLHHCQSSVAVVVDVVTCRENKVECFRVR